MEISRHCLRPNLSDRPPQKKAPNIIPRYTMLPGEREAEKAVNDHNHLKSKINKTEEVLKHIWEVFVQYMHYPNTHSIVFKFKQMSENETMRLCTKHEFIFKTQLMLIFENLAANIWFLLKHTIWYRFDKIFLKSDFQFKFWLRTHYVTVTISHMHTYTFISVTSYNCS